MRVRVRDAHHRRVERIEFLFHDDRRQLGAEPQRLHVLVNDQHAAGLVERGEDLIVYYGAADTTIAAARVPKRELVASLAEAIKRKQGGVPL